MKVALFLNYTKNGIFEYAAKITKKLQNFGADVFLYKNKAQDSFDKNVYLSQDIYEFIKKCDAVLTIGGDGTLVHLAKYAAKLSKPILGINFGRLGFITGLEQDELDKLELFVRGNYAVQNRALLEVSAYKNDEIKTFFALNDAVISKGESTKIVDFSVQLNNREACNYRADGLILSTSTGSTAYSLSAGGPIISPDLDCILMTPICSHSMFARPMVFSDKDVLEIETRMRDNGKIFLNIDGDNVLNLVDCDKIVVKCANMKVKMVSFDDRSFCKRLSEKMAE